MMMTTNKLITSDDPKGRKATDLFRGVYNKAKLTEDQAQRLNENRGSEFTSELLLLIQKHSGANNLVNGSLTSGNSYPKEYKGPKPIEEQIKIIANVFGLDETHALVFAKNLPTLPVYAEGWFAIPKVSAVSREHFPKVKDKNAQYCEAVKYILKELSYNRHFFNDYRGEITPGRLRQHAHTTKFLKKIEAQQKGDIIIIAAQFGMRYRGKSVYAARKAFANNEFGLGSFAVGCMTFSHEERFARFKQLDVDCAGDESRPMEDYGFFTQNTIFRFFSNRLEFDASDISDLDDYFGSVSAFAIQR